MTMRKLIPNNSDPLKIEDHMTVATRKAKLYGGPATTASELRLVPSLAELVAAREAWRLAEAALGTARAAVEVQDEKCRMRIFEVHDMLWIALGRPRTNRFMTQVFPSGANGYSDPDPYRRPRMMAVLQERVDGCKAEQITPDLRKTWMDGLQSDRTAMIKMLTDLDSAEDVGDLKEATWRTNAKLGQEQLRLFKRDLENAALSRVQIFDIIPDASPTPKAPKTPSTPPAPPANTDTTTKAG